MPRIQPLLVFTPDELDLLGRTADALSAYMGKPVLAEVVDPEETGYEWALFAVPLDVSDDAKNMTIVQVGGQGSRILGNAGGLDMSKGDVFDCEYLWAIQLSNIEGVRFIKVDHEGEESGWSDDLRDLLPFVIADQPLPDDDDDDGENGPGDDDDDLDDEPPDAPARTLH
ncbi:MAG: hypothetical protein WC284_01530 [Candidimonas sp.]